MLHVVPEREPWVCQIVDMTVGHVCPDCNHHWMSDMESKSRALVLPFIRGEPITLDFDQQVKVAAWCYLKAITLELGRPPGDYPDT